MVLFKVTSVQSKRMAKGSLRPVGLIPGYFLVELHAGYTFDYIHYIIVIKHNNLFWNRFLNV